MATINEQRAALATLYRELEAGDAQMKAGTLGTPELEALEAKAIEAETIQADLDEAEGRAARISTIAAKARGVPDPVLPGAPGARSEQKATGHLGADGSPVVGYMSIGEAFTGSPEFKRYIADGLPRGQEPNLLYVKGLNDPQIEVTQRMLETKAVPVVGTGVLRSDRLGAVQRLVQYDRLRLRDVLNVSQTGAASVSYITENAVTLDATPVAESGTKPETTLELAEATSPVRTLAVTQPVTEQQLQDVPNIRNLIDTRMMYQLAKLEENQFMYGSGSGQNLQGIASLSGVPLISRTVTDVTNLDRIRIGVTDVLVAGYEPNAVAIHPVDWEAVVLLKETGKGYIWTVVTDAATGQSRVWGLAVVETVAMKAPTTTQRYFVVGDFRMGATVWDRQQATVAVGWVNAQFKTNERTIRAEERLAFGVQAPLAFAKYETAVAA